jgi:hypothetical protein
MTRTRVLRTAEESSVQSQGDDWVISEANREAVRRANRRRAPRITWGNATRTAAEWGALTGVPGYIITNRLRQGWPVEDAINTPLGERIGKRTAMPEKQRARAGALLGTALKNGVVRRPNACEECGRVGKVDGHHAHGYEDQYALIVDWLCRSCHRRRHSLRRVEPCAGCDAA